MATMQPIRTKEEIERFKNYFLERNEVRNYTLFILGINLPLRISDILSLKWKDVYNFSLRKFRAHVQLLEQKTSKTTLLALNQPAKEALEKWMEYQGGCLAEEFVFPAHDPANEDQPLSRITAYVIMKNAAEQLGMEHIGCHSLRKTFGYHAWKNGIHLALIMAIYNHTSIAVTKRYLCIEQEDKDEVFEAIQL